MQPDGGYVVHRVDDGEPILREEIILDRYPSPLALALGLGLALGLALALARTLAQTPATTLPLTWTGTPWPPR